MKKFLLLLFLGIFSVSNAQKHTYGVSAGLSISKVHRPAYDHYRPVVSYSGEGNYMFQQGKFFVKSSFDFTRKGYSQEIIYVNEAGDILGQGNIENTHFAYLGFSQLGGIQFGNKFYGYCALGMNVGYYLNTRVSAAQFELNDGSLAGAYDYKFKNLTPLDVAAVGEFALALKMSEEHDLLLTTTYHHGLKDINYQGVQVSDDWSNNYLTIRFGWRVIINERQTNTK